MPKQLNELNQEKHRLIVWSGLSKLLSIKTTDEPKISFWACSRTK